MRRTHKQTTTNNNNNSTKPRYYYVTDDLDNVKPYLKFFFEEKEEFTEVRYKNTRKTKKMSKFKNYKDVLHLLKSLDLYAWTTIEAKY